MNKKFLINTFDIALIVDSLSLGARAEEEFKQRVWEGEQNFLNIRKGMSLKEWLYDIQYKVDCLYDKDGMNEEYASL